MSESDKKKVVPFSVRFDPELFDSIEKHLSGIRRDERPSKDRFIQDAVSEKLTDTRSENGTKSGAARSKNRTDSETVQTTPVPYLAELRELIQNSNVTEDDVPWILDLIKIRRSHQREAIEHNIKSFVRSIRDDQKLSRLHKMMQELTPYKRSTIREIIGSQKFDEAFADAEPEAGLIDKGEEESTRPRKTKRSA